MGPSFKCTTHNSSSVYHVYISRIYPFVFMQ